MCLKMAIEDDKKLIDDLGGPTKLAEKLGPREFSPQRVGNWKTRGIPAKVKVDHPDLFLKKNRIRKAA